MGGYFDRISSQCQFNVLFYETWQEKLFKLPLGLSKYLKVSRRLFRWYVNLCLLPCNLKMFRPKTGHTYFPFTKTLGPQNLFCRDKLDTISHRRSCDKWKLHMSDLALLVFSLPHFVQWLARKCWLPTLAPSQASLGGQMVSLVSNTSPTALWQPFKTNKTAITKSLFYLISI